MSARIATTKSISSLNGLCVEAGHSHWLLAAVGPEKTILFGKPRRLKQILVDAHVMQFGARFLLRLAHTGAPAGNHCAGFAAGIIQVARQDGLCRADDDARGLQVFLHPVRTEVAFGRGVAVGIDVESVVGAGLHAALASDTTLIVKVYDSIRTAEEGVGGADLNAGSIVTVVTSHHPEVAPGVGKFSRLHILQPGAKHSHRDLMLFLASQSARVAADTSLVIDHESITHRENMYCTEGVNTL